MSGWHERCRVVCLLFLRLNLSLSVKEIHILTFITIFYFRTDVVQVIILYVTLIVIAVKGTMNIGGLSVLIQRNMESGRIQGPE